jgi:hypothetical protein
LYLNCKNNIGDNLRFSIEFSTEIILLCIRISINIIIGDRNNVVATVTRCVSDGWKIESRSDMIIRGVQTGSETHAASYKKITGSFPVTRHQERDADHPPCSTVGLQIGTHTHPVSACINIFWHGLYLLILTLTIVVVLINVRAYDNDYCYYYYIGQMKSASVRTQKFSIRYGLLRRPTWLSVTQKKGSLAKE